MVPRVRALPLPERSRETSPYSGEAGIHGAFEELVKDADVLQHYLYNPQLEPPPRHGERRRLLIAELLDSPRPT